jgi:hypothetical protein
MEDMLQILISGFLPKLLTASLKFFSFSPIFEPKDRYADEIKLSDSNSTPTESSFSFIGGDVFSIFIFTLKIAGKQDNILSARTCENVSSRLNLLS